MKWGRRKHKYEAVEQHSKMPRKQDNNNNNKNIIQKHKEKLISKYIEKGYSPSAAEIIVKQRMKTELVIGVIGAVAVGILAKKAITRIGQDYCDKVIKSGKIIQNINDDSGTDFNKAPFFAAVNKHDKKAYRMMFPYEKREMLMSKDFHSYNGIYKNDIAIMKNIKRASVKNARKILYDKMNNDSDFRSRTLEAIKNTAYGKNADRLFAKNPKRFYDNFNRALATPNFQSKGIHKDFYSALEKKGYNALLDINDTRYSGYKYIAKAPTIFFGDGMFKKIGNTKISEVKIDENSDKYVLEVLTKSVGSTLARFIAAREVSKNVTELAFVKKYLHDHPNSKLTKKEIIEKMNKNKFG